MGSDDLAGKIDPEEPHARFGAWLMTAVRAEVQISPGRKPAIAFDEFAAHNPHLLAMFIMHVFEWPTRTRCHIDDPSSDPLTARKIASKATRTYLEGDNVVRDQRLQI
jgi:hypothetical protein